MAGREVTVDACSRPGGIDPAADIEAPDLRAAIERLDVDERAFWPCATGRARTRPALHGMGWIRQLWSSSGGHA